MSDNRLFNVNGENAKTLKLAIKLAFMEDSYSEKGNAAKAYLIHPLKGLIFLWTDNVEGAIAFDEPLYYKKAFKFATQWLESDKADSIHLEDNEQDIDHDGFNSLGWRVYFDGLLPEVNPFYAICAVKPCYLWHGK